MYTYIYVYILIGIRAGIILAGLESAQCSNTARALAQTQGSAHWLYFTIRGVCVCVVW